MSLRDELIQVAAVACAIVEDLDEGSAEYMGESTAHAGLQVRGFSVLCDVAEERHRQDKKWGPQHHGPAAWLAILAEEVGEAAREADAITDWDNTWSVWRTTLLDLIEAERRARVSLGHVFGETAS